MRNSEVLQMQKEMLSTIIQANRESAERFDRRLQEEEARIREEAARDREFMERMIQALMNNKS